jgi:hypothetical protein
VRLFSILLLLLAAAIFPLAASAKRVALVVGIDQYENLTQAQQLKKAASDSHAVGETLRSLGYSVQQVDNVKRLDFLRQWQQFLNRIEPGDDAAFFFAGHGVEINGLNFLLPADVPRVASGEEEVLKASALSLSSFLEQARERKPQMTLYVIDACRDNPFANSTGRSIGRTRGLTLVEPPTGTFVMFSAGAGETALDRLSDSDTNPNSIYTRTLLPRLKAPGRIGDIARDVRREVHKLASGVNHIQTPAFYDEVIGDFCPAGCVMEAKADPTSPIGPTSPVDPALQAWNATRNTESIELLTAYVAKHKDSFYAEIAKARIEELKRRQRLAVAASPKPQKIGPDPALEAWNAIKDNQNIDVLEAFIGQYPLSFYAELARAHLKGLKQKWQAALVTPPPPKAAAPPPDPALHAWNETKTTESVTALEAFYRKYPDSFYAELAKAKIDELRRKQRLAAVAPAKELAPAIDPSLEAWRAAGSSGSISVLETFVNTYPLSFYARVAKARIEELKLKEQEGTREAKIREIQKSLKDLECYGGPIDGVWGDGSTEALHRFARLAKLDATPGGPSQDVLDTVRGWKGNHCAVEKVAVPSREKAARVVRERPAAKIVNTPKATETTQPKAKVTKVTPKERSVKKTDQVERSAKKAGQVDDFDTGSVYCHQGCAGGFTSVLKGTAKNPGMKR